MHCPIFFSNLFLVEQSNIEAGQGGRISHLSRCSPLVLTLGKGLAAAALPRVAGKMPRDTLITVFSVCSVSHLRGTTQRLHRMLTEHVSGCSEGSPSKDRASPASQEEHQWVLRTL